MTAAVATRPGVPAAASSTATLRELALADGKRYARHPLFIVGALLTYGFTAAAIIYDRPADPVDSTIVPAFFLGVFGFVVAHRLTTSMRRTEELVDALPSSRRRRTLALCLACGVPFLAGVVALVEILVVTAVYPPVPVPADAPMVWFGHQPWPVVLAALLAMGPVACLGGPLLGVVVGTWAPFRGSALVGVVLLVVGATLAIDTDAPWRALPPWASLVDEYAVHGHVVRSTVAPNISPVWDLVYVVLLCALGVVAALLHEREGRRPLLCAGAALALAAAGAFTMTVT